MSARISRDRVNLLTLVAVIAVVAAVLWVRFQAAPVPLERDEGEYALMGQLILDGVQPYREAANMKLPGTYYAYAAVLGVFGQTTTGIRLGLLAVNLLSAAILYLIARSKLGKTGAALSGASFLILSAGQSALGLFAHATHFVVLFALAGVWLLMASSKAKNALTILFVAGLCLGLAILMKQSGAFFALFGFLWGIGYVFRRDPSDRKSFVMKSVLLAGGIVIPYAALLMFMARQGLLDRFWFWTVDYARAYISKFDFMESVLTYRYTINTIIGNNLSIWLMAFVGLVDMGFARGKERRVATVFLLGFYVFSFLAVCPGFYFRKHYFIQLFPAVALLAGAGLLAIERFAARYVVKAQGVSSTILVGVLAVSLSSIFSTNHALSTLTPDAYSRSLYGLNPFPESVKVADYLAENTKPEDRIAILGSEPQIYFYAHRRPATEYIYMYGLMEKQPFAQRMQEDMIAQTEKRSPTFIVFASAPTSWIKGAYSETNILLWMKGYLGKYYRPVLAADILHDKTVWLAERDCDSFNTMSGWSKVIVFKRKNGETKCSAGINPDNMDKLLAVYDIW